MFAEQAFTHNDPYLCGRIGKGEIGHERVSNFTKNVKVQTGKQLVTSISDYDMGFCAFLREIQLYLIPVLFLELKNIFLYNCFILKVYLYLQLNMEL